MQLTFTDHDHKYQWSDGTIATSVTTLVGKYCPPFLWTAEQSSRSKKVGNKWAGMDPVEIQAAWDAERDRSTVLGSWYHNKREQELLGQPGVVYPIIIDGVKHSPEQRLSDGIYPEHLVHMQSANIAGQSDYVKVADSKVYIRDYKTSKEIKKKGFVNWEGIVSRMLPPLSHLEECEYNHYSLQLSIYMYMILRHNNHLQPGDMYIEHILFEEEGKDKYGYPIYKREGDEYIVKEVIEIAVPYLKKEVQTIIERHKQGK